MEVTPIRSIDKITIGKGVAGPITRTHSGRIFRDHQRQESRSSQLADAGELRRSPPALALHSLSFDPWAAFAAAQLSLTLPCSNRFPLSASAESIFQINSLDSVVLSTAGRPFDVQPHAKAHCGVSRYICSGFLRRRRGLAWTSSARSNSTGGIGLLGIALAHGFAIAIMVSALGHISGGHFNPAITIGFWVTKRLNTLDALAYWGAQLAGCDRRGISS